MACAGCRKSRMVSNRPAAVNVRMPSSSPKSNVVSNTSSSGDARAKVSGVKYAPK